MNTFVSLLRGINVSGKNKIIMSELKQAYESLGFENVVTYIQSGNIVFSTHSKKAATISDSIESMILKKFGYKVSNILRSNSEIKTIYQSNPFLKRKAIDISKLHVAMMQNSPTEDRISNLGENKHNNDEFIVQDREIYLYCPDGYGKTKFSNTYLENKLKIPMTTRNWKTIGKLVELIQI